MLLWRLGHKRHFSFHVGYSLLSLALGEGGGGQVTYMRKGDLFAVGYVSVFNLWNVKVKLLSCV